MRLEPLEAIEARDKDFVGRSYCDWAYHIMLHSEPPPSFSGQFAEAIQAGHPTLKIFTTNILPGRTGRMIDFGDIWEAFQRAYHVAHIRTPPPARRRGRRPALRSSTKRGSPTARRPNRVAEMCVSSR